MVTPHEALTTLSRLRLLAIATALEFDLPARAAKQDVVEALLSSPQTSFELILSALTQSELMVICRASGLNDTGRQRTRIVDLILGREKRRENGKPVRAALPATRGRIALPRPAKSPPSPRPELPQVLQPDPEEQLNLRQLEGHLWEAANILRGKIDSSDFKHYIFGLLFYKRLCDVWEEEYEQRLGESGDPDLAADPHEHRFHIPEKVLWKNIRQHTRRIGEHLNRALRTIENANGHLSGVFQDVDFNNRDRFPDATLELLLQHFEKYRLRNVDVERRRTRENGRQAKAAARSVRLRI